MVIWKKINDDYLVSSTGKVYSYITGKILRPVSSNSCGHLVVYINSKPKLLHRLVANAFIPNPNNLPFINHRDENPRNNVVENLEWCTPRYNSNYGSRNNRISYSLTGVSKTPEHTRNAITARAKKVYQYKTDGTLVKVWNSADEATTEGFCIRNIRRCCNGERITHKGFRWSYKPL